MVGRVEEEGEEKNGTAIPAKDILKQRCSGKELNLNICFTLLVNL